MPEAGEPAATPKVTVEPSPVAVDPPPTTTIIARPDSEVGTTVIPSPPSPPPSPPAAESAPAPPAPLPDVTYVPLAVTVGDGFKLGCGFFMALAVFVLVGLVMVAALFALSSATGVSLPFGR